MTVINKHADVFEKPVGWFGMFFWLMVQVFSWSVLDYFRTLDIYERWLFKKPTFLLFLFNPAALPVGPGRFEIFGGQLQVQPYEFRRYFQRGGNLLSLKPTWFLVLQLRVMANGILYCRWNLQFSFVGYYRCIVGTIKVKQKQGISCDFLREVLVKWFVSWNCPGKEWTCDIIFFGHFVLMSCRCFAWNQREDTWF